MKGYQSIYSFSPTIISFSLSSMSLGLSKLYNCSVNFQFIEKEVKHKVYFCTDKHQSIQKVGTIVSDACIQACLTYSRIQYLKKIVSDEVDFLHADKHQNFLKGFYVFGQVCVKYPEKFIASL